MSEALLLAFACVAGVALGALFFGGLWWTVAHSIRTRWVALWLLGGFCLRFAGVLTGFYLVAQGHWQRLLACVFGFVMARVAITYATREGALNARPSCKASHASQS